MADILCLSELRGLSEADVADKIRRFRERHKQSENDVIGRLDAWVEEFEARFGMSTDQMLQRLVEGEIEVDAEVLLWARLAKILEQALAKTVRIVNPAFADPNSNQ